ncbi:hypothetical protein [Methylomagnum ishizawai]|uniref:hypothetical protein n=1 Tax=Methylomagnum ishizawai TaxID=1760988 RepID=UPI001C3349D0|nr:hypothetical protein [Methylomagnum ishizawai]BBL73978.1 hypothetical protein MishRS11D_10760 [Methylomagnum ishizawai]
MSIIKAIRHRARSMVQHIRNAIGASVTNAAKTTDILDLGAVHSFTKVIAVKRGLASTGETLLIEQAHDGDQESPTWVSCPAAALTGLMSSPASAANMVVAAVPTARWVRVKHTNGNDNAQTALILELTAQ